MKKRQSWRPTISFLMVTHIFAHMFQVLQLALAIVLSTPRAANAIISMGVVYVQLDTAVLLVLLHVSSVKRLLQTKHRCDHGLYIPKNINIC